MSEPDAIRDDFGSEERQTVVDFDDLSHEGVLPMADQTVYETGASFVDNDKPAERLTDMPAWLQTFAASAVDTSDVPDAQSGPEPQPSAQHAPADTSESSPEQVLPEWLSADSALAGGLGDSGPDLGAEFLDFQDFGANGADSFISEDDLPDWLRAFSTESAGESVASAGSPATQVAASAMPQRSAAVRVPPVENIWLSAYERQALGPGRTLFALLASNTATLDEAEVGQYDEQESAARQPRQAEPRGEAVTSQETITASAAETSEKTSSGNSMRVVLLVAIIAVLLVIVAYAALA